MLRTVGSGIEQCTTAKPDIREGVSTLGILEAMSWSTAGGEVVKVSQVLDKYGIQL